MARQPRTSRGGSPAQAVVAESDPVPNVVGRPDQARGKVDLAADAPQGREEELAQDGQVGDALSGGRRGKLVLGQVQAALDRLDEIRELAFDVAASMPRTA